MPCGKQIVLLLDQRRKNSSRHQGSVNSILHHLFLLLVGNYSEGQSRFIKSRTKRAIQIRWLTNTCSSLEKTGTLRCNKVVNRSRVAKITSTQMEKKWSYRNQTLKDKAIIESIACPWVHLSSDSMRRGLSSDILGSIMTMDKVWYRRHKTLRSLVRIPSKMTTSEPAMIFIKAWRKFQGNFHWRTQIASRHIPRKEVASYKDR